MPQYIKLLFDFVGRTRFLPIFLVCLLYCKVISCVPLASEEIDEALNEDSGQGIMEPYQFELSESQKEYFEELNAIMGEFNENFLEGYEEEVAEVWNDVGKEIAGIGSALESVFSPKFEDLNEDNLMQFFKEAEIAGKVADGVSAHYNKKREDSSRRFQENLDKKSKQMDVRINELNMRQSRRLEDNSLDYDMSEDCEKEYNTCFLKKIQDLNIPPIDVKNDCWVLSTTCQNEYRAEGTRVAGEEFEKCEKLLEISKNPSQASVFSDDDFVDKLIKCNEVFMEVAAHFQKRSK